MALVHIVLFYLLPISSSHFFFSFIKCYYSSTYLLYILFMLSFTWLSSLQLLFLNQKENSATTMWRKQNEGWFLLWRFTSLTKLTSAIFFNHFYWWLFHLTFISICYMPSANTSIESTVFNINYHIRDNFFILICNIILLNRSHFYFWWCWYFHLICFKLFITGLVKCFLSFPGRFNSFSFGFVIFFLFFFLTQ